MRIFAQKPKSTQRNNSTNSTTRGKTFLAPSYAEHPILRLQCTVGNQAVLGMLQSQELDSNLVLSTMTASRFGHDFSRIPIYDKTLPLIRQVATTTRQHTATGANQTATGAYVVTAQRPRTSGKGLTGGQLGPVDALTFRMNGVELQFDINPAVASRYRNLRPKQWSGTDAIWVKRGSILGGKWNLKRHSRGSGEDSPESVNIVTRNKVIAFYDSPGPNVYHFLKSRPSRVHVIQNFTSWIEGAPISGGPPKRLNEVLAWYSVVSLADENWGKKTPKWVRFYGNRIGTGWTNTKTHPPV